uniref:testis-specific Y-encoded protein 3-like n=1 Tax=Halichoerus grypus TaxID=9711 RepID=UPI0016592230
MAAEAVQEAEARQGRDEPGTGEELVVVVEDLMAALDCAAQGEEEGEESQKEREEEEAEEEAGKFEQGPEQRERAEWREEPEKRDEEEAEEEESVEEANEQLKEDRAEAIEVDECIAEEAKEEDGEVTEEEKAAEDFVEEGAEGEEAEEEEAEEDVAEEEEAEECEESEEGEEAEEAEGDAEHEDRREEGPKEEEEAQQLQEKQKGEGQPEARRAPSLSSLEALEALQSDMEPVNKEASKSHSRLKLTFRQRRQRLLEHRSSLIRGIPGFWAKAFVNHPQMSAMISEEDEDLLGYMMDLKVEELSFPHDGRKILLFFLKNPYFRNEVVVKEYVLSAAGYGPSHSPPIQWHQNYEQEAYSRRHHNTSPNFFNWFSDHSFAGSSRI